ncbi:chemotaxis protein [Chelativorans sp. AA-79]|uniref:chemotaxis protein n=1 Tax=Chelativorans sp. AA-79 TaxID=3028735 RepID=UPI0023F95FDC|nr:chemotaxis protein [Chelativorans sp. AA-79]WEX08319.1 chemotaxis protein [Chelativorans sp. AA-79]
MRRRARVLALAAVLACPFSPASAEGLEPYQMVRSLQLVQDRIADGDHAALPMQRKLLAVIDERLQLVQPEAFADRRNFEALLIYGTSGGNPATLERLVSRLEPEGIDGTLSEAVVSYARGDLARARELLGSMEPEQMPGEAAASLMLVAGSLVAPQDPRRALQFFDAVRLIAPGTLLEEAALRRSIPLSAEIGDTARFSLASLQYVRRFLRSPYASQFAEAFVSAVMALHDRMDTGVVEEVAAGMEPEQAHVTYLRIARQSVIEGHDRLLAFAAANAERYAELAGEADPRAVLYANAAAVASQDVEAVLETLDSIDERRVSVNDRKLLRAARRIARSVLAPPPSVPAGTPRVLAASAGRDVQAGEGDINRAFVASARERLKAIDALLQEDTR